MSEKFSPLTQPEAEADDSMQLKRNRLAADDHITDEAHAGYVDRLLRSAPILSAPLGFAERVIARLKAEPPRGPRYEEGVGIAIGLGAVVFIVIPMLASVVVIIGISLFNEDFRDRVWRTLETVTGDLADFFVTLPTTYPGLLVLLIIVVVLFIVASGYFVWFWRSLIRTARHLKHE